MEKYEEYFERVKGYSEAKNELLMLCDVISNQEKYEEFGVKIPRALLIHGEQGVGKTLLAECFMKATCREKYIIRKDSNYNEFVEYLRNKLKTIRQNNNHPKASIVLFDDIDKFAGGNDEIFTLIHSFLDSTENENIFVVATATSLKVLPNSLIASNRFGNKISLNLPKENDIEEIIKYYLSKSKLPNNVDVSDQAKGFVKKNSAYISNIINRAIIHAVYNNKDIIEDDDIWTECMRVNKNN